AVARAVMAGDPAQVTLSCAGTSGHISLDDLVGAACIARELVRLAPDARLSDMTTCALALLRAYPTVLAGLQESRHGIHLMRSGFGEDVLFAAQLGILDVWFERDGDTFEGRSPG